MFYAYFGLLDTSLQKIELEIVSDISKMQYRPWRKNIEEYGRITVNSWEGRGGAVDH